MVGAQLAVHVGEIDARLFEQGTVGEHPRSAPAASPAVLCGIAQVVLIDSAGIAAQVNGVLERRRAPGALDFPRAAPASRAG